MNQCKFCNNTHIEQNSTPNDTLIIICPVCGYYKITRPASMISNDEIPDIKAIPYYLKNNSTIKNPITLKSDFLLQNNNLATPRSTPLETKINKLILFIGNNSSSLTESIIVDRHCSFPLFYASDENEFLSILDYLQVNKLLYYSFPNATPANILYGSHNKERVSALRLKLTFDGWKKFDKLRTKTILSTQVFVAMSFDEKHKYIYHDAIYPACEKCKFDAFRIDSKDHNEKICDRIVAEIKRSKFLIADFTGQKHGVYFEAGFARGLNIPVIWCCHKKDFKKLHFDTRQYNHIKWETTEDLKSQLIDKIDSTIN
ncbi:hypothetical protein ACFL49_00655 [Candidatus Omnitrophota bacterium]